MLDLVLYAVLLSYAVLFATLRFLGAPALAVAIGCAMVLWLRRGRPYQEALLYVFAGLGFFYVLLSAAGLLHGSLTMLFQRSAIAQQAAYIVLLPLLVPVFAAYHERIDAGDRAFLKLDLALLFLICAIKLVAAYQANSFISLSLIQLYNTEAIFSFLLIRRILSGTGRSSWLRLALTWVLLVTAGSFQSVLSVGFVVILFLFARWRRQIVVLGAFTLILAAIVSLPYAEQLWGLDPNTGIRSFFWRDALYRVWRSGGLGVGFGTETIRPLYAILAHRVSIVQVADEGFIFTGSHNAFVDATYRMGVVGLAILATYIFRHLFRVARSDRSTIFDCWAILTLLVILMVNVGLASINFTFGSAFFLGWLVYRMRSEERMINHLVRLSALRRKSTPAAPPPRALAKPSRLVG